MSIARGFITDWILAIGAFPNTTVYWWREGGVGRKFTATTVHEAVARVVDGISQGFNVGVGPVDNERVIFIDLDAHDGDLPSCVKELRKVVRWIRRKFRYDPPVVFTGRGFHIYIFTSPLGEYWPRYKMLFAHVLSNLGLEHYEERATYSPRVNFRIPFTPNFNTNPPRWTFFINIDEFSRKRTATVANILLERSAKPVLPPSSWKPPYTRSVTSYLRDVLSRKGAIFVQLPKIRKKRRAVAEEGKVFVLPVCALELMGRIPEGLSHEERVWLVCVYAKVEVPKLVSQGMDEKEAKEVVARKLIEAFKKSPDYKERVTTYQVRYLLGLAGPRKIEWFKRYTCRWARRAGVCPRPRGPYCRFPMLNFAEQR